MFGGLDDTDSLAGGCTTHALFALLEAVPELALAGPPRLVRLNPNNPRKTRGNGAVAFRLVHPEGPAETAGAWRGKSILAYPQGRPARASEALLDRLWAAVEAVAQPEAASGLVIADTTPQASVYWDAVRTRVAAPQPEGFERGRNEGWGLIGARAALAWPGPPSSFELIAYRDPSRIGTPRTVDAASLDSLDATEAFHTYDAENRRLTCVPNTPCPVLAGLRSRNEAFLLRHGLPALRRATEPFDTWMLWATNQASGDHVVPVAILADAPEWGTIEVAAEVEAMPERRAGGHLFVALRDSAGAPFTAAAFEPTKRFRDTVAQLRPGDRVTVVGALEGGTVRLEKLRVDRLVAHRVKAANPACPSCGKAMKSAGAEAGYRCRSCGTDADDEAATWLVEPRALALGWHEVPVAARRHLHRPVAWAVAPLKAA